MSHSHAPWGAPPHAPAPSHPPAPSTSSAPHGPPPRPVTPVQHEQHQPSFSSSFAAFGLNQPRVSTPGASNLTMQLQGGFGASAAGAGGFGGGGTAHSTAGSALFGGGSVAGAGGLAPGYPFPPPPPPSTFGVGNGNGARRPSTLASDAMAMEDSSEDDGDPPTSRRRTAGSSSASGAPSGGADEMMSLSPSTVDLPPPSSTSSASAFALSRRSRSRSASESGGAPPLGGFTPAFGPSSSGAALFQVPPSPVTVARALQAGQKTPPPFLQRRLFKEEKGDGMHDDGSGRSERSRSGSSSDVAAGAAERRKAGVTASALASALMDEEDEEIEQLSEVLSRSASGEEYERVVRRPVSRKPNLLPKTKSHLRVLTELRGESLPGDQSEIASEATLHRLSRAGAAVPPSLSLRSSCPPSMSTPWAPTTTPSALSATAPNPFSAAAMAGRARPPPNRFPESAGEDDDADLLSLRDAGSPSSSDGGADAVLPDELAQAQAEQGSDWGGMSVGGYGTEDDEERRTSVMWNGIRSGPGGSAVTVAGVGVGAPSAVGKSPGKERAMGGMDVEFVAPSTPSTFAARPGKRKINDDRFEPYAHQAFKRRAVSPAAASLSLSPGFHPPPPPHTSSKHPTPPPLHLPSSSLAFSSTSASSSTSHTAPVAIPSPTSSAFPHPFPHHHSSASASGLSSAAPRSLANSPSGSLSSSAGAGGMGRGFSQFVLSDRHRPISAKEEMERLQREMRVSPEGLGRMSLGGEDGEEEL
ncbi:hypothetical protein JCM10213_003179 [Rhodosporidiobolus nylandii]